MRGASNAFDACFTTILGHHLLDSVLDQRPAVLGKEHKLAPVVNRLRATAVDIIPQEALAGFANRN
jgi:hypothetical protein